MPPRSPLDASMATEVHYVGGSKDGDNEAFSGRPPERNLVAVRHGHRSVLYWLFLVPVDEQRSLFVYASSGMPTESIQRVVKQRMAAGELTLPPIVAAASLLAPA